MSASFQIFAVTAGGVLGWESNCPGGELSGGGMSEGEMTMGHVLNSTDDSSSSQTERVPTGFDVPLDM